MRKMIVNILCSTGITLLILAVLGTIFGAKFLFISSVFQSFIANIIIHIGLLFTHKFESNYAIFEIMLDIGYTVGIVIVCSTLFKWYSSTPIWTLIIMAVTIYFIGVLLSILQMRRDIEEINELLQKRNYKAISR
ncbi:DUF3021 family protein [Bacilliculturomica massiliensis]|uniref:DUF3021 family protein n=1 Tax=Bacilliculturomica massiliensis TaxID=1917867 RepID=UPI00103003EB|nr:DUF3021 family protein [Bacilliculturomica massiliensis]